MNGDPVVCGGSDGVVQHSCFHYHRDTKKWEKVKIDTYNTKLKISYLKNQLFFLSRSMI